MLIIDEAHEGIRTEHGKAVVAEFQKNKQMKSLYLSGTPYKYSKAFQREGNLPMGLQYGAGCQGTLDQGAS